MRFMIMMKGSEEAEAGAIPDEETLRMMSAFNRSMVDAGVLISAEGLHPSSKGARVRLADGKRTVIDGPFTEAKELIAGFWLIDVASLREAVGWVERLLPAEGPGEAELEIRQVYDQDAEIGVQLSPEIKEAEARMREQLAQRR